IMIHGQRNGFGFLAPLAQRRDWTDGCIAVNDREMEEIWRAVPDGTIIDIRP
ncbi:MAG: L,D-transpeptidase family protein, partial [Pseudomonadota bacterium]